MRAADRLKLRVEDVPLTMPPRTVTVMLARSTPLIERGDRDGAAAERRSPSPVLTVSPSANSTDAVTCATLRLAESEIDPQPAGGRRSRELHVDAAPRRPPRPATTAAATTLTTFAP